MQTYEVTQKILSVGPTYEIRGSAVDEIVATVRGKLLTLTPKLTMTSGASDEPIATLSANLMKTKFVMRDAQGNELATLSFPLLQLRKSFCITAGGRDYKAGGGLLVGEFKCVDADGQPVLVIAKQLALRDKFSVTTTGVLPREVALLAAVSVDQKLFQDGGLAFAED